MQLRERYVPQAIFGFASLWLLLVITRQRDKLAALVSGVKTKTTETNQALEDLAQQIRDDPSLQNLFHRTEPQELRSELEALPFAKTFREQFGAFLAAYGHREATLTISQPAWKDQPENVLAILKVLAETQPQGTQRNDAWQRTRDKLLGHPILGTRLLRRFFLRSLSKTRALFQIREDTHFYVTLVQPTIRRVTLELGGRLVQAGALERTEDVFHLRLNELEELGASWPPSEQTVTQIREVVGRRKAKRESLANKPMVDPRLLGMLSQAQSGEDVLLHGMSGSPGVARGPVRVIHDVSEFGKLQAGDVLVAPATNPAWTPLFQRAAAVVVDTGGSASHAAIVAREYGVPAVMATMNGTKELKDGQLILVDGTRGLVLKGEKTT
jgi:pyruvate,water dikinase